MKPIGRSGYFLLILFSFHHCISISESYYDWGRFSAKVDQTCSTNNTAFCVSCGIAAACLLTGDTYTQYNLSCSNYCSASGECASVPAAIGGQCGCKEPQGNNTVEFIEDPYNSNYYTFCYDGAPTYYKCTNENEVIDSSGQCVVPPETTTITTTTEVATTTSSCSSSGLFQINCTAYIVCGAPGAVPITVNCGADQYFDPNKNECVAQAGFSCSMNVGVNSYRDPYDCQRFYICSGTTLFATDCCYEDEYYNQSPTVAACVKNDGSCIDTYECKVIP